MTMPADGLTLRRAPGRPREFDIDAALDGALLVFRERGYHAASLNELGAAMKLTAGSIYKAFRDKRSIFLAAFDRYTDLRGAKLRSLLHAETSGFDKVGAMLRHYAETSQGIEGRRGCLVAGSAMELASYDVEMALRVKAALQRVETTLRDLIRIGQADGSISTAVDADVTAHTLFALLQGFRVIGKVGQKRSQLMATVEQVLELLTGPRQTTTERIFP